MRRVVVAAWVSLGCFFVACGDDSASPTKEKDAGFDASGGEAAVGDGAAGNPDSSGDAWAEGPTEAAADGNPDGVEASVDSDGDCLPDGLEAPGDVDGDGKANDHDLDSDGDGLGDQLEDSNCNGQVDTGETSPVLPDTDGDGDSDLAETAAGTNPKDPNDSPTSSGYTVIVLPYGAASAVEVPIKEVSEIKAVDAYLLVDRSSSMASTLSALQVGLSSALSSGVCPPAGTGTLGACLGDLGVGVGSVGYVGSGGAAYQHIKDIQTGFGLSLPTGESGGCCDEGTLFALWSALTGKGTAASGCVVADTIGDRTGCPGGATGYPCFRSDALPFIYLFTDEPPMTGAGTLHCPSSSTVTQAAIASGARIVGIHRAGGGTATESDLNALATATRAVDSTNGNAPLVFDGAGSNAPTALKNALALSRVVPVNLGGRLLDDPSDAVDVTKAFEWRIDTAAAAQGDCVTSLSQKDSDQDGHLDTYLDATTGATLCWKLVVAPNTKVGATGKPQSFKATVEVVADGRAPTAQRPVFFVVPAKL
ncbi:MAG: hypothetical protein IT377_31650 [Polyangiaceae bacterium]|nr:hypothetical protein [Polyangiaceae bacterium]